MFDLTRQERTFVAFLVATALLGLGIRHYKLVTISKRLNNRADQSRGNFLRSQTAGSVVHSGRTKEADVHDVLSANQIIQNKEKIDINSARFGELMRLPGIGPKLASRIIEYRENHGSFSSVEQIKKVKGMGSKKFEKMRDFLRAKRHGSK